MNPKLIRIAENLEKIQFESKGHIYHPLPFPEFQHLSVSTNIKSTYRKWSLIYSSLEKPSHVDNWRVLDVGASAGYFSYKFSQLGAIVDAYEPHSNYCELGRQLSLVTKLPVQWHNKDLELADLLDKKYDISLVLSVFQWISRGNENLEEAEKILSTISDSCKILYFELGCNRGKSSIHVNTCPIFWIWNLLQKTTSPKRVYFLGRTKPWRRSYRYLFVCTEKSIHLSLTQRIFSSILQQMRTE